MAYPSEVGEKVREWCASGRYSEALRLYADRMSFRIAMTMDGGVRHAQAVAAVFAEQRLVWRTGNLYYIERSFLFDELGMFAQATGNCSLARKYFQAGLDLDLTAGQSDGSSHNVHHNITLALQRLALLSCLSGPCDSALGFARHGSVLREKFGLTDSVYGNYEIMAYAHFLTGNLRESERLFSEGIATSGRGKFWYLEADVRSRAGDILQAERVIADAERRGLVTDSPEEPEARARQQIVIARVHRDIKSGAARESLADVLEWALRVGHCELSVSARVALLESQPVPDLQMALDALAIAEQAGYNRAVVTLRCLIADRHLADGDPRIAFQYAKAALSLSVRICDHSGYSHALHSFGCAMLLVGSRGKAWRCLTEAAQRLHKIRDPLFESTQNILRRHFPATKEEA